MKNVSLPPWLSAPLTRRNLLIAGGGTLGLALLSQREPLASSQKQFSDYPFSLGVASGDPCPIA
jgi:alkaline phosphatase D